MQEEQIVVGLDIGTTKICVIVGRRNEFGKLEILGLGKSRSDGVVEGTVRNIGKTVEGIVTAIKQAEELASIDIGVVNVGIAGKHIKSLESHGGITRKAADEEITVDDVNRLTQDMYRLVTEPGSEIIHVMPQHYTVDHDENIKDPVGHSGVKLEGDFHIITAQTNSIRNIKRCVEKASLEIENMILEPLASSISVLSEEEKEAGVVLVDIGGGTTDVAVFEDGIIRHTAVIPFGGNIITSDIKQGCAVLPQQAELLKVKFGRALAAETSENEVVSIPGLRNRPAKEISVKNLAYIIEARMEEIIDLVMLEVQRSGYQGRLAGGVVITGGGADLRNIKQLFEYKTGMDARIGFPNEHLGKSKIEDVKKPMYATAIGLVMAGFRSVDERQHQGVEANYRPRSIARSPGSATDFFSNILRKTRDLLIDDFDDKSNY